MIDHDFTWFDWVIWIFPDEVLSEVEVPSVGEILDIEATEVVMDRCEDNIHMTLLGVKGVASHVVLTDEVNIIHLRDLKLVLWPFEQVNIVTDCHVSLLKGEVVIQKDSDGCIF